MTGWLEKAGVQLPIVQAGMGGGLAGHGLAAVVAEAGGLGTIGFLAPADLRKEIAGFRARTSKPLAVNLLLPLARRAHFQAAAEADVLVTFWGRPRRGNVRGTAGALELLARIRQALPRGYPVMSAGGIAEPADARQRLDAGADAVVCGTRFVMTHESGAHPAYKQRLVDAQETILTELFGAGWPAPHRVVPNEATRRWLSSDPRGPAWLRAFHRATAPLLSRVPVPMQLRLAATQSPDRPLFGPAAATAGGPANLLEAGPLYAGECVSRISDIRPAAELVRELTGQAV